MSHCDIRVLDRLGHSVSLIRAERTRSAFLKKKETANCFAVSLMPLSGEISPVCCCIQMVKGNACKACYYSLLDAVLITGYFFDYQFDYQMIYIL